MATVCEIVSAGCDVCNTLAAEISALAGSKCTVVIRDMQKADIAERAAHLGIKSVPSVVIDGVPADCCAGGGPDITTIRTALGI